MSDFIDVPILLMFLAFVAIIMAGWGTPIIMDLMVTEDATWEFHNSIVQDKYIVERKGFPFGSTEYFIKIDNQTMEMNHGSTYWSIIPNETWLGYWVNVDTGEMTTERHI